MTRDDHDLYDDNDGYDGENCRGGHSEEERDNDDESGENKSDSRQAHAHHFDTILCAAENHIKLRLKITKTQQSWID